MIPTSCGNQDFTIEMKFWNKFWSTMLISSTMMSLVFCKAFLAAWATLELCDNCVSLRQECWTHYEDFDHQEMQLHRLQCWQWKRQVSGRHFEFFRTISWQKTIFHIQDLPKLTYEEDFVDFCVNQSSANSKLLLRLNFEVNWVKGLQKDQVQVLLIRLRFEH